MQIHIQQIGPGMVQQIQTVCIECKGQGERINPKDRCENCSGAKVTREKKIIEVHVEKGEAGTLALEGPDANHGTLRVKVSGRWLCGAACL